LLISHLVEELYCTLQLDLMQLGKKYDYYMLKRCGELKLKMKLQTTLQKQYVCQ